MNILDEQGQGLAPSKALRNFRDGFASPAGTRVVVHRIVNGSQRNGLFQCLKGHSGGHVIRWHKARCTAFSAAATRAVSASPSLVPSISPTSVRMASRPIPAPNRGHGSRGKRIPFRRPCSGIRHQAGFADAGLPSEAYGLASICIKASFKGAGKLRELRLPAKKPSLCGGRTGSGNAGDPPNLTGTFDPRIDT